MPAPMMDDGCALERREAMVTLNRIPYTSAGVAIVAHLPHPILVANNATKLRTKHTPGHFQGRAIAMLNSETRDSDTNVAIMLATIGSLVVPEHAEEEPEQQQGAPGTARPAERRLADELADRIGRIWRDDSLRHSALSIQLQPSPFPPHPSSAVGP